MEASVNLLVVTVRLRVKILVRCAMGPVFMPDGAQTIPLPPVTALLQARDFFTSHIKKDQERTSSVERVKTRGSIHFQVWRFLCE